MSADAPGPEPGTAPEVVAPPVPWRHDLVAGLLVATLGAAVVLHVRTFPQLPDGQPGPALFPGLVGGLLLVCGLALVVRAVHGRGAGAPGPDVGTAPHGRLRALAVLGLILAYVLLAETLGFAATMGVLLLLLMWLLGARPLVAAVTAAVTTGVIVLVFQEVLLVPLPTGPFG